MTVQSTDTRVSYVGDGVIVDFPFTMKTYDSNWIDVYEDGVLSVATIIVTLNVDQKNNPGGSVNIIPAPALDVAIIIERYVSLDQLIDYTSYNGFPADDTENGLDKLTFITQQLLFDHARAVRQSGYEDQRNMLLPSITERALRFVGMDQDGNVEMSDVLGVPVQHLDCTVSINAEPYNADNTGVTDSRIGIQAALDSGANLVIACPGIYLVDYFNVPSNVTLYAPGATFIHSVAANEGDTVSLGVNNKNLTVENSHLVAYMLSGYESVNVENYRNCSIGNTIIDQCELGLVFGAWAASGIADNFVAEDVIIQSCVAGGITGSAGVNNKSNINFRNVSVLECGNETRTVINTSSLSGSWIGGDVKRNTGNGTMGLDCDDAFKLSGVTFDENGNATPSYPELTVFDANGLTIDSCTFEATDITKGRTTGINFAASAMNGFVLTGNKIVGTTHDSSGFWGILCTGGPTNGFIAGNNVTVTGIQTDYLVDTVNNYLVVDGAKV